MFTNADDLAALAPLPGTVTDAASVPGPDAGGNIDVDLPGNDAGQADIAQLDDGSVMVNLDGGSALDKVMPEITFDANLAEHMDDSVLGALGVDLVNAVAQDIKSYADWTDAYLRGIKYLGFKVEEKTYPFKGACGAYDPLLAEAVVRFQATARGELLPADGPVKVKVVGQPTPATEAQAERVKGFMNLYLTEMAPEYYEDTDKMLMWLPIVGSTFKKVYQDPVLARARSDFVPPDQFVVNQTTTNLQDCGRMTHTIPMNGRDLKQRQLTRFYRNVEVRPTAITNESDARQEINYQVGLDAQTGELQATTLKVDENYMLYEVHTDLDLAGFEHVDDNGEKTGLPLPYIVTIDKESTTVLSVRRNWKEGDRMYKRGVYFVHYKFLPGLGFYGYGYAHILGGNAVARTSIMRQLVDSGTFANFPGGVRAKGARFENNNLAIAPGEFPEIETGGLPIDQVFKPLPYKEPSPGLFNIYGAMGTQSDRMASMVEIAVGEGRQDAPVGTTVALMEAATKVESAILKRLHVSFREEFRLFAKLFGKYLEDKPYPYAVEGGTSAIMRTDFDGKIDVIPVSDPNITSSSQRIMRSEAILRLVQGITPATPPYTLNAMRMLLMQMGIQNPEQYLPPPPQQAQPADPLTENQNAMRGMPVVAAAYQDHDAHIMSHAPIAQTNPMLAAHIQEHLALKYRVLIEQQLGHALPQGQKLPPQIENQIAIQVAQATQALHDKLAQQNPGAPQTPVIDPGFAMLQDTAAKVQIASSKAEGDALKVQADLTKARIASDDRAQGDATKLQIEKMHMATAWMEHKSSADKPLPAAAQ